MLSLDTQFPNPMNPPGNIFFFLHFFSLGNSVCHGRVCHGRVCTCTDESAAVTSPRWPLAAAEARKGQCRARVHSTPNKPLKLELDEPVMDPRPSAASTSIVPIATAAPHWLTFTFHSSRNALHGHVGVRASLGPRLTCEEKGRRKASCAAYTKSNHLVKEWKESWGQSYFCEHGVVH